MTQYHETLAHGVDVSHYQSQQQVTPIIDPDFDKIAILSEFAFIRLGQNNFLDARGSANWQNAKGAVYRGGYWFFDWRSTATTPEQQGALFLSAFGGDMGELPPVMDFEKPWGNWTTEALPERDKALELMQRFKAAVGTDKMVLYINQSALKTLQPFPDWLLADWYLWIAAPPLIETSPGSGNWTAQCKSPADIPDGWTPSTFGWDWKFWQYTWKLDGLFHGVQSLDLDGNIFNGTPAQLATFAEGIPIIEPPEEPPEEEPTMTNRWIGKPLGKSVQPFEEPDMIFGDFGIVSLGDGYQDEDINDALKAQVAEIHAQGKPAIGLFKIVAAEYALRSEGLEWKKWNYVNDPWIVKKWYPYYLERLIAQGVDAVMFEIDASEGAGTVAAKTYKAVSEYMGYVIKEAYGLHCFQFIRKETYDKYVAKGENSTLDNFFLSDKKNTLCDFNLAELDNGYPVDDWKPNYLSYGVDFCLFTSVDWICVNRTVAELYALLNWTDTTTLPVYPPEEPPEDDPIIDDDEPAVIGDLSEVMAELVIVRNNLEYLYEKVDEVLDKTETVQVGQDEMNAKLDRILEFIEAVKDA